MASALKAGLSSTPTSTGPRPTSSAAPLPAIRYAAAAAAAVAPAVAPAFQQASVPAPAAPISTSSVVPVDASPVSQSAAPLESPAPVPSPTPAAAPLSIPTQPVAGSSIALAEPSNDPPSPSSSHEQAQPPQQQQQPSQESRPTSRGEGARLPNALADLVSSFENAKQRCQPFRPRLICPLRSSADVISLIDRSQRRNWPATSTRCTPPSMPRSRRCPILKTQRSEYAASSVELSGADR